MSDFAGFKESYFNKESPSTNNSGTVSGEDSASPPAELAKQKSLNIPIIVKQDNVDAVLSRSLEVNKQDIRRQLSQSLQNSGGHSSGGVNKPQSRKNSIIPVRSNNASDAEDDDDDRDQGNERKRRDNINEKIQELLTLIPPEFFQDAKDNNKTKPKEPDLYEKNPSASDEADIAAAMKNSGTKDGKPNKGQILTKSVEYLQYLQNLIDENNRKEVELIMKLKTLELQSQNKPVNVPITVGNTSAERALGKIGVGPLSDDYFKTVLINSANSSRAQRRGSG
ncbi:helix-loop-helix DNA-binding domain-containing protein [Scheffersomyces xylosifermentans]|uniref:helix-loop-helix DNA-binding domain-containing protein n=1 Tax=Scheffersomyces xylosifermentans TaxID=1304137 RepID=UPI00315D8E6B